MSFKVGDKIVHINHATGHAHEFNAAHWAEDAKTRSDLLNLFARAGGFTVTRAQGGLTKNERSSMPPGSWMYEPEQDWVGATLETTTGRISIFAPARLIKQADEATVSAMVAKERKRLGL